jgi:hypothetical protein
MTSTLQFIFRIADIWLNRSAAQARNGAQRFLPRGDGSGDALGVRNVCFDKKTIAFYPSGISGFSHVRKI